MEQRKEAEIFLTEDDAKGAVCKICLADEGFRVFIQWLNPKNRLQPPLGLYKMLGLLLCNLTGKVGEAARRLYNAYFQCLYNWQELCSEEIRDNFLQAAIILNQISGFTQDAPAAVLLLVEQDLGIGSFKVLSQEERQQLAARIEREQFLRREWLEYPVPKEN